MFAERCSLGSVGVKCDAEDSSVLAPGAQPGRYAFESCLTLATVTFIVRINHEHCLKAHSVEQALSSCACRMTFTTSGRGPVKIAKV